MVVRRAVVGDVPAIVGLLADDELGAQREAPDEIGQYLRAFAVIDASPQEVLVVAEEDGVVVGTLQLTVLPGLSHRGMVRAQVEGVRVAAARRGGGLGEELLRWALEEARARGCAVVQLTSDLRREDAHRFYERLGFVPSHQGFKYWLDGR
ncbi:GNAT family N-acetyltransferase [Actinosynnema sp. NPDC050436]|uniref:GNAT family N-acetyltransferase n=1 Tax=Actinosynnema sp. NPDC050436 TaxID=3155659 RepID=UPI0033CDDD21